MVIFQLRIIFPYCPNCLLLESISIPISSLILFYVRYILMNLLFFFLIQALQLLI
jgi:hypothetical protein